MHGFTLNIIRSRREAIRNSGPEDQAIEPSASEFGIKRKMALLDVLLQSTIDNQPLTDHEIQEEVDTFMFEGHDTTTLAISFTVYLLSQHAEVQTKLFEEIQQVIGLDKDTPLTQRNLQDLKYLDLVLKESMRLYPPVPIIGRFLNEDVVLSDGKVLPAQSNFNLGIYFMNRSAKHFPNPEEFVPERFEHTNSVETTNPYVYIPFSAGPRNCIGMRIKRIFKSDFHQYFHQF
jgi:cytochrome P450 family 4